MKEWKLCSVTEYVKYTSLMTKSMSQVKCDVEFQTLHLRYNHNDDCDDDDDDDNNK